MEGRGRRSLDNGIGRMMTLASLMLFLVLESSVYGKDFLPFRDRKLVDSVIYNSTDQGYSSCRCVIMCASKKECTAYSYVHLDSGKTGCYYSNLTALNLDYTEPNTSAVTFIMHEFFVKPAASKNQGKTNQLTTVTKTSEDPPASSYTPTNPKPPTSSGTSTTPENPTSSGTSTTPENPTSSGTSTTPENPTSSGISTTSEDPTACQPPFVDDDTVGCVTVVTAHKTWGAAKTHCESINAELYVAPSEAEFHDMRNYLLGGGSSEGNIWVGAKNRQWNDGRDLTSTEWGSKSPNGDDDECVFMWISKIYKYKYHLGDKECYVAYPFLCKRTLP